MKDLRRLVVSSLFVAVGFLLHYVTPPVVGGMKPDFMLLALTFAVLIYPAERNVIPASIVAGLLSALTTAFPGGQVANIVDKLLTGQLLFFMTHVLRPSWYLPPASLVLVGFISALGTMFSGTVFLLVSLKLTALPVPPLKLFLAVVLPAALVNAMVSVFLYMAYERIRASIA